ncbi:MAG TPA: transposase family protein [Blastocatellia bacterium]|nr:transposase family protein [Blastocatellia bacterium]
MSLTSRQELTSSLRLRYQAASYQEKQKILDEYVAVTSYHRKAAIRILRAAPTIEKKQRTWQVKYDAAVKVVLEQVWQIANRICGKRLVPLLQELIPALEKFDHLALEPEVREKVLALSPATADRLLREIRKKEKRSKGTTRRGKLLKSQIPLRTFAEWEEVKPGFLEADLVAHCGDNVSGQFLNTLTLVDVASGWTECLAILCKEQNLVLEGLKKGRALLPFVLLGVDTDNGSEFLNEVWLAYCQEEELTFTRSRPYRKNDQCFVEQKNGAIVRRMIGYDRYEGRTACEKLGELYGVLRLYQNYFQPSMKLLSKKREGAKVIKKYGPAQTPYQRLLNSPTVSEEEKARLRTEYEQLDPLRLFQEIEGKQQAFWALTVARVIKKEPVVGQEEKAEAPTMKYYRKSEKTTRYSEAARNRTWRTRRDPFAEVWEEIEWELLEEPSLEPKEILRRLQLRHPGQFPDHQIRTLQRRVRNWRLQRMKESVGVIVPNLETLFTYSDQHQHEQRNRESNIFT